MATRPNRNIWIAVAALAAIALIGGVLAVTLFRSSGTGDDPSETATSFLRAWQRGNTHAMTGLISAPTPAVAAAYTQQSDAFGSWPGSTRLVSLSKGETIASARFETTFRFKSGQTWSYRGVLPLRRESKGWRIRWTRSTVHPLLTPSTKFRTSRVLPTRAPILADDSTPLTVDAPVVVIGIEPRRIKDRTETTDALRDLLQVDPQLVASRLDAPGVQPDYFVEITRIDKAKYDLIRDQIYPVPGLIFHTETRREAATPQLGAHVVGSVGPITAELLEQLGPSYVVGDVVGLNGLERTYEKRLAGTASHAIDLVDTKGKVVQHLATKDGVAPQSVRTALDLGTQRAAEAAIGTTSPAAFVVLRPSDGAIRAVVSTPITEPFDRALDGAYPPGSTFKVVTSTALLEHGTTAATAATCPPTITVNGRTFQNFEGESAPTLPFSQAFAISCNTAFIGLAQSLPADALGAAAKEFGFGAAPQIGLNAKGGTFPEPKDATERVAAAIGQGRVTASPLAMAGVAATVDAGTWHSPSLVLDPAPTSAAGASTAPLAPNVVDTLRSLMTGVVQNGTGTAAAIPGQLIAGKTGTAEFGTDTPPKTHAWFIGFTRDLAFAVVVEGGGVGGRVAAPIARTFLLAAP